MSSKQNQNKKRLAIWWQNIFGEFLVIDELNAGIIVFYTIWI